MGKRGKRKSNKEYAIRLVHPEWGDWYYQYTPENYYWGRSNTDPVFTQNLSKVTTWKTTKSVEQKISDIQESLNKKKKIRLNFGKNVDDNKKIN